MRATEIDIIIEQRSPLARIIEKLHYLTTQYGIQSKIGTEHHHIVTVYFRKLHIQPLRRIVFIEQIFSIILLIQKS